MRQKGTIVDFASVYPDTRSPDFRIRKLASTTIGQKGQDDALVSFYLYSYYKSISCLNNVDTCSKEISNRRLFRRCNNSSKTWSSRKALRWISTDFAHFFL